MELLGEREKNSVAMVGVLLCVGVCNCVVMSHSEQDGCECG